MIIQNTSTASSRGVARCASAVSAEDVTYLDRHGIPEIEVVTPGLIRHAKSFVLIEMNQ